MVSFRDAATIRPGSISAQAIAPISTRRGGVFVPSHSAQEETARLARPMGSATIASGEHHNHEAVFARDSAPMTEIKIYTTDQTFLDDLNAAGIEGVKANCRPEMAFDTAESIWTIVVTVGATAGLKFLGDWMLSRLKRSPPPTQLTINHTTINAQNVVTIINNFDSKAGKQGDE
jgi:hypothetical protein